MNVDVYTASGAKKGTVALPASLFEAAVHHGLMHEYLRLQRNNRRHPIAHVKTRAEVKGSTRKMYRQKGTGRARRGQIRSPIVRGGGKSFGPQKNRNWSMTMTRKARHAALRSCLTYRAQHGGVIALEGYDTSHKTKTFTALLQKLPVPIGRTVVFVLPEKMQSLERGSRNVPGIKTIHASYLNPEDILGAHALVFVEHALEVAEKTFGKRSVSDAKHSQTNDSAISDSPATQSTA